MRKTFLAFLFLAVVLFCNGCGEGTYTAGETYTMLDELYGYLNIETGDVEIWNIWMDDCENNRATTLTKDSIDGALQAFEGVSCTRSEESIDTFEDSHTVRYELEFYMTDNSWFTLYISDKKTFYMGGYTYKVKKGSVDVQYFKDFFEELYS